MDKPLIILGAGGHSRVLLDILNILKYPVVAVCDPVFSKSTVSKYYGYDAIGDDNIIENFPASDFLLLNGLGFLPRGHNKRFALYKSMKKKGYSFATLIHPSAVIGSNVELGEGAQVMAGSVIQPYTSIGDNTIINSRATIDHECRIGKHCHVAPGVVLSGNVSVGDHSYIGAGAVIIQGITVGEGCLVGAGATIIKNLSSYHKQIALPPAKAKSFNRLSC